MLVLVLWFLRYWRILLLQVDQRKKANPKLFINFNLDDIVQLKFNDDVFVPMSTFACCQKTTAF